MTATERTLAWLRKMGYTCAIVEKWNPHVKIRQDLFGVIDILAMKNDHMGIVGVQTTTTPHHAEHKTKILASEKARLWTNVGQSLWLISWRKIGDRGKRKLWEPKFDVIKASDFPEAVT